MHTGTTDENSIVGLSCCKASFVSVDSSVHDHEEQQREVNMNNNVGDSLAFSSVIAGSSAECRVLSALEVVPRDGAAAFRN